MRFIVSRNESNLDHRGFDAADAGAAGFFFEDFVVFAVWFAVVISSKLTGVVDVRATADFE